jgi:hypothetical protein
MNLFLNMYRRNCHKNTHNEWQITLSVNFVGSSWNVMAQSEAREGKWRGNWRLEWVASTLHATSKHCVSSITTADAHTSDASNRMNAPADLHGLVRFAERRNLVSARVPSHFKRSLSKPHNGWDMCTIQSVQRVRVTHWTSCPLCRILSIFGGIQRYPWSHVLAYVNYGGSVSIW